MKGGVSQYYSPPMIMHPDKLDYNMHYQIIFGAYAQALNDPNKIKTQAPGTIAAIYFTVNFNKQGGSVVACF